MDHYQSGIKFISFPAPYLSYQVKLKEALVELALDYDKQIGQLDYNFVPREKIIEINITHLSHDYPTDIITFDYCVGKKLSAELFLCPDVIEENAKDLGVDFMNELFRVVFHGALHLMGFNDKTTQEQIDMRKAEDECLVRMKE